MKDFRDDAHSSILLLHHLRLVLLNPLAVTTREYDISHLTKSAAYTILSNHYLAKAVIGSETSINKSPARALTPKIENIRPTQTKICSENNR